MVLRTNNPVLSLHFVCCYGYRLCICSHFFVHYLGDRVEALGEYCQEQRNRMGLTLLMYFLLMPFTNFFHLSFAEVFLMPAKLLFTFSTEM